MPRHQLIISDFTSEHVLTMNTQIIACPIMIHNYGLAYYLVGFQRLVEAYPNLTLTLAIPCQNHVGLALRALDAGVKVIYFNSQSQAWSQLVETAAVFKADLIDQEVLDG